LNRRNPSDYPDLAAIVRRKGADMAALARRLPALGALVVAATCWAASATPASAFSFPGYVVSYYMDTANTTTVMDIGCALGTARKDGSAPQDALVILDYGQPQLRSGVYGSFDFGDHFQTVTKIRNAVVEFAHGFWRCTGSNVTAHVRIAVGTNNFGNFSKSAGMSDADVTGHGRAWATMVNDINNDIAARGYQRQADAVGAADIEVSWGTSSTGRRWVDGYDDSSRWPMYNFGDAAGCRQTGTTAVPARCGSSSWFQDDLYYVTWGAPPTWGVPEIYREDGAQARQWQQISKWATLAGKDRILFAGTLTQRGACGAGCPGTNNAARDGWTQLRDACADDAGTALGALPFAADIRWH
jgi:hypothetical protein